VVRNGSASKEHNAVEGIETGSFIVDIESLKQSYGVQFTWVVEETSNYDNGYPVIVRCLSQEEQIYDFDNCVNMFEDDSEKYPITKDLPIALAKNSLGSLQTNRNITVRKRRSPV
jgi:hypothetical protein